MPRYGMCSACGTTVWLTESGGCPQGHGPECLSGIAESIPAPRPAGAPVDSGRKSNTIVIAAVVVAGLLLCCLVGGMLVAIAVPVFNASSDAARQRACFSQQRVMEGAAMQWAASYEGRSTGDFGNYDALVEAVVPEYVYEEQVCPDGGTYDYDPATGEVSCSVHGHYE